MKLTTILKALFVGALTILLSGCQQSEPAEGNVTTPDVTILLDLDKVTLESANVRVRHTGAADLAWVYMITQDLETPAVTILSEKIAADLELTSEIVAYTGTNKSISITDLDPKSYYRFICQGIDRDTRKTIGTPSELTFRTRRDPAVFEVNENWSISVGDRVVNNTDKQEYDNFILASNDDESYVLVPLKVADFEFYYNNDLQAFFEDYQSSYGYELGDSKWKDVVKSGDMTWAEQRLRSGDWFIFMIGIDSEGELTGYYQKLELTIEQEVATKEYNRWLGTWQIVDMNGNNMFQIDILPSENNMWYYMSGWEIDNVYGYDTTDPALMAELYFDKETGEMCFISQYLNTLVDDAGSYDFYFSGTFTYGNTYVLGSEVLNYRMADAEFLDSSYTKARVEANEFTTQGLSFPIQQICIMYSYSGQLGAISLAPPTLPLTMTQVK